MEYLDNDENILLQTKGSYRDVNSTISFGTDLEAFENYQIAKQKLLNVSSWHVYSGKGKADFQLTDYQGNAVFKPAQKGDLFRINIPGPGSTAGDGYDWVQIPEIREDDQEAEGKNKVSILVKPATNHTNGNNNTAHFFTEEENSTFMVRRDGNELSAEVHGRNELPIQIKKV